MKKLLYCTGRASIAKNSRCSVCTFQNVTSLLGQFARKSRNQGIDGVIRDCLCYAVVSLYCIHRDFVSEQKVRDLVSLSCISCTDISASSTRDHRATSLFIRHTSLATGASPRICFYQSITLTFHLSTFVIRASQIRIYTPVGICICDEVSD